MTCDEKTVDPRFLARRIVTICEHTRINVSTEAASHLALGDALRAAGLEVQTEVKLSASERIDLLVDCVGIEVKVGGSRRDIFRQLQRYAANDRIAALVLATATPWSGKIGDIGGKPFFHASLTQGWL